MSHNEFSKIKNMHSITNLRGKSVPICPRASHGFVRGRQKPVESCAFRSCHLAQDNPQYIWPLFERNLCTDGFERDRFVPFRFCKGLPAAQHRNACTNFANVPEIYHGEVCVAETSHVKCRKCITVLFIMTVCSLHVLSGNAHDAIQTTLYVIP